MYNTSKTVQTLASSKWLFILWWLTLPKYSGEKLVVCFYPNKEICDVLFMPCTTHEEECKYKLALNSTITKHIIILFCLANLEGFLGS